MHDRSSHASTLCLLLLLLARSGAAMPPPRDGGELPAAFLERTEKDPKAFTFGRALLGQARRIQRNRELAATGALAATDLQAVGGIVIQGERAIPVIPVKFKDTQSDPFPIADLQRELFDGPFPTGTMTEYYKEVSYDLLTVTGTVRPWAALTRDGTFYEGPDFVDANGVTQPCNGICEDAGTGDLLKEALETNDPNLEFGQFDNDGPDGAPNSGDDDGFVDFVAFVHPVAGGECRRPQSLKNIWSHRWMYSSWKSTPFVTKDQKHGGGFIKVNDYVITPALACDNVTMIQIGVFAHEFGHAFGLPDLYDTDSSNGDSEGVGNWCLMAGGSWGGDGDHPERPAHLSAWAKAFLGWIFPHAVDTGEEFRPASIAAAETTRLAFKIPISGKQFYLVENRQKQGFDEHLPGEGLLIWKINESVIEASLPSNRVNADENNKGVALEQADGLNELDGVGDRGDAGDIFAGSSHNRRFHNVSRPRSIGKTAVCDVNDPASLVMQAHLLVGTGDCADAPPIASPGAAGASSADAPTPNAQLLSIQELAATPGRYLNRSVRLTGTLMNLGTNYFTDRRIVLQDSEGNILDVRPWLPLESPRGERPGPPTLANYLGKRVEVVGELELKVDDGERLVLDVESAEIVPPR